MPIRKPQGKPKIIALVGPTASGKSALGVFLAQKLGGEIISADSRQVYRKLNIGTGKITKREMKGVPHHMLDVASLKKQFSADDFVRLGEKACFVILQKTKIPIVVGGTGLYVDALLGRTILPDVPPNQKLREQLEQQTTEQLFTQLKKLDPRRARAIEPKHKRRIIRAIEIAYALGKNPVPKTKKKYEVLWLGINIPEKKLGANIHIRLFARMRGGMVAEAKKLHREGLSYKRMEELGLEYRYLALFLQGKITREKLEQEIERGNWQYTKRQMRWFKRNPDIHWVKNPPDSRAGKSKALQLAKKFLSGTLQASALGISKAYERQENLSGR